jgi:hypothetical protein
MGSGGAIRVLSPADARCDPSRSFDLPRYTVSILLDKNCQSAIIPYPPASTIAALQVAAITTDLEPDRWPSA